LPTQISIQIRILRKVQESEARRQEDTQRLIESLIRVGAISPDYIGPPPVYNAIVGENKNALQLSGVDMKEGMAKESPQNFFSKPLPGTGEGLSPSKLSPAQVLSTLCALHDTQNSRDAARDLADLRNSMRAAMQNGSDAELCAVLQVARDEMPEALKTLQRVLERLLEKESREGSGEERTVKEDVGMKAGEDDNGKEKKTRLVGMLKRTKTAMSAESGSSASRGSASWSGSEGWSRDTLDREFIESGIDALRRMSGGESMSLPSWTITR
jgi:abelson tyrosine-protein kinase 1